MTTNGYTNDNGYSNGWGDHGDTPFLEDDDGGILYPSVHIGRRLKELCADRGIKQSELAVLMAPGNRGRPLDPAVPSTWMGGNRYRPVPGKYLPILAKIFDTTVTGLISEQDEGTPSVTRVAYVEEEEELAPLERPLYVPEISGHTIGGWVVDEGPRPVAGRPISREYRRLDCRHCGYQHCIPLGAPTPRSCADCAKPLGATVTIYLNGKARELSEH